MDALIEPISTTLPIFPSCHSSNWLMPSGIVGRSDSERTEEENPVLIEPFNSPGARA